MPEHKAVRVLTVLTTFLIGGGLDGVFNDGVGGFCASNKTAARVSGTFPDDPIKDDLVLVVVGVLTGVLILFEIAEVDRESF